jgi:hypothetical protein
MQCLVCGQKDIKIVHLVDEGLPAYYFCSDECYDSFFRIVGRME